MSWKVQIKTNGDVDWVSNGLRYATCEIAERAMNDLISRWMAPTEWQVAESNEPVNTDENGRAL